MRTEQFIRITCVEMTFVDYDARQKKKKTKAGKGLKKEQQCRENGLPLP